MKHHVSNVNCFVAHHRQSAFTQGVLKCVFFFFECGDIAPHGWPTFLFQQREVFVSLFGVRAAGPPSVLKLSLIHYIRPF